MERLLLFQQCDDLTGSAICEVICTSLKKVGLNPINCRAQNYDGAANMSGKVRGVAAVFNETYGQKAPYVHCCSHDLNLVLCKSAHVPVIRCMMEDLKKLGLFFVNSPKRLYSNDSVTAGSLIYTGLFFTCMIKGRCPERHCETI